MEDNYWHIVPRRIIDRAKYKGLGRPRKEDYMIITDENCWKVMPWVFYSQPKPLGFISIGS